MSESEVFMWSASLLSVDDETDQASFEINQDLDNWAWFGLLLIGVCAHANIN